MVGILAGVVSASGQTVTSRGLQEKFVSILVLELVGERVEVKGTSNRESNDKIWGGNEGVRSRVSIVTTGEVSVVRRDNGVGLTLLNVLTIPLTDARTTAIEQLVMR